MREITIAGGGLAGLSLGIALARRGVPVALHEAGTYPRHRVCGEFICGVDTAVLEELSIRDLLEGAIRHQNSAWFHSGREIYRAPLAAPAAGLSRHRLDDALKRRFLQSGGKLFENSRLEPAPREGLVWSAGRIPGRGKWLGLKCHAEGLKLSADLEMHLGRNGYVGLGRIEGGRVNVCGLFRGNSRLGGKGSELLRAHLAAGGLNRLAERLENLIPETFAAIAGFRLGWQAARRRFALGDACGMIPPFTGNGMSMAFESAFAAIEPLLSYATARVDWSAAGDVLRKRLARQFSRRMFWSRLLHPFLTAPAGQVVFAAAARARLLPFSFCFRTCR